jgi:hypothetical protein
MSELKLKRTECGHWVADWMGHDHQVAMSTVDDLDFVSMGLVGIPPVRIEITPQGEILKIADNRTGTELKEVVVPKQHFLHRDLVIGKPFSG